MERTDGLVVRLLGVPFVKVDALYNKFKKKTIKLVI